MKKNAKIAIAVVAVVVVIAVLLGVYFATRPETAEGAKTITVEVTHSDGSVKTFTCHTDAEYLEEVLLAEKIVEGEEGPYGLYILCADGERAVYEEDGAYWGLTVNGESAMQGAGETPVIDGETYGLVYTVG